VSPSGAINFNLVAKLTSSNLVGAAVNTAMNSAQTAVENKVGGLLGGLMGTKAGTPTKSVADRGIPITITGTTQNPSIRANIGAMLR
jgi:hypothetical protein